MLPLIHESSPTLPECRTDLVCGGAQAGQRLDDLHVHLPRVCLSADGVAGAEAGQLRDPPVQPLHLVMVTCGRIG